MFQKVVNMAPKWAHLGAMLGSKIVSRYKKKLWRDIENKIKKKLKKRSEYNSQGTKIPRPPDVSPSNSPYLADAFKATPTAARQASRRFP